MKRGRVVVCMVGFNIFSLPDLVYPVCTRPSPSNSTVKLASVSEQSLAALLVDLVGTSWHIDHPVSSQTVVVVGSTVACLNIRGGIL